jgi:hypothetical protein
MYRLLTWIGLIRIKCLNEKELQQVETFDENLNLQQNCASPECQVSL